MFATQYLFSTTSLMGKKAPYPLLTYYLNIAVIIFALTFLPDSIMNQFISNTLELTWALMFSLILFRFGTYIHINFVQIFSWLFYIASSFILYNWFMLSRIDSVQSFTFEAIPYYLSSLALFLCLTFSYCYYLDYKNIYLKNLK